MTAAKIFRSPWMLPIVVTAAILLIIPILIGHGIFKKFSPTTPQKIHYSNLDVDQVGMPGEFESCDAIVLGCNEMVQYHPRTMLEIISLLRDHVGVVAMVDTQARRDQVITCLVDAGIPPDSVDVVVQPTVGMWIRDYGPIFVRLRNGKMVAVRNDYLEPDRKEDNRAANYLAGYYKLDLVRSGIAAVGGNLLSNGRGLIVSTTALISQNEPRHFDLKAIAGVLGDTFKTSNWVYLAMLNGEPTGHVDMFVTFTAPDTAVVGSYDPKEDAENSAILDEAAHVLAMQKSPHGEMKVVRIPMPPHRDGLWRSYTNVIFANGILLVPQYPDVSPELDKTALEVYAGLLPDWKIVGVDARTLIAKMGALHCVSINVPAMD